MHQPYADRICRWGAFWRGDTVERPLLGAALEMPYATAAFHLSAGPVQPADLDVSSYIEACDRMAEIARRVPGDAVWAGRDGMAHGGGAERRDHLKKPCRRKPCFFYLGM